MNEEGRTQVDEGEVSVSARPSPSQTSKPQTQPPAVVVSTSLLKETGNEYSSQTSPNAASKDPSRAPSPGSARQLSSTELPLGEEVTSPFSQTEGTPRKKLVEKGSIFLQTAAFCLEVNALQVRPDT